jgi:hypothetical protein
VFQIFLSGITNLFFDIIPAEYLQLIEVLTYIMICMLCDCLVIQNFRINDKIRSLVTVSIPLDFKISIFQVAFLRRCLEHPPKGRCHRQAVFYDTHMTGGITEHFKSVILNLARVFVAKVGIPSFTNLRILS